MLLDNFKLRTVIFQLQYAPAFEIWDRSGAISRRFTRLWPSLKVHQAEPNRVSLRAPGIEVRTELETAIVVLDASATAEVRAAQIRESVAIWKSELELLELLRVSMRVQYTKEFPTIRNANDFVLALNMVKFPTQKVFDQPIDGLKNGVEAGYRFEDESTFTTLHIKAESLEYKREAHPEFAEDKSVKFEKNRVLLDFDRGSLKPLSAKNLNAEEWIKGYFHVLRRDLDKVIKGAA